VLSASHFDGGELGLHIIVTFLGRVILDLVPFSCSGASALAYAFESKDVAAVRGLHVGEVSYERLFGMGDNFVTESHFSKLLLLVETASRKLLVQDFLLIRIGS